MTRRKGGARRGGAAELHGHGGRDHAGRAPSQRQLRVGEEMRHALARILARGDLGDPALDGVAVTVTEVRMSPDLRAATAFVTPFGGGDATAVVKALNRAGGYFRGQIAHEVKLRLTPSVRFTADLSFDQATRVEQLLRDPVVARDLDATKSDEGAAPGADEDAGREKGGDGA